MIASVIRWSARNIFLVGLAAVFVTFAGIYAVSRVPLDAIPDLSDVQVIVYTEYPGQAPQVVEDQVTEGFAPRQSREGWRVAWTLCRSHATILGEHYEEKCCLAWRHGHAVSAVSTGTGGAYPGDALQESALYVL